MKINKIGIIGGTHGIGEAFAKYFQQKFPEKEIMVSGRSTEITNKKIVQECDLVIFSVPIKSTAKVIDELIEFSHTNQIWADFTSVKQIPVKEMLKSNSEVCGLHPMFGPKGNFINDKVVFCPERISHENLESLKELFVDFEIIISNPTEHDKSMQIVQGISHFSDLVTGGAMRNSNVSSDQILKFSSPSYKLKFEVLGRMFAQNPDLYAQIIIQNFEAIETYFDTLVDLKKIIDEKNTEKLAQEFSAIADYLGKEFCEKALQNTNKFFDQYKVIQTKESKNVESISPVDLAIFGEEYSHTDEASFLLPERKDDTTIRFHKNIFEVFEAVETGFATYGILPYENSIGGTVFETLDELFVHENIQIVSAVEKDISQTLIGLQNCKLENIKQVLSHPQAISQSKKFLRKNLKKAEVKGELSTAVAAQKVKNLNDPTLSAIGSERVAKNLELKIIAANISDRANFTRFILIQQKPVVLPHSKITSLAFWFSGDHSGNLSKALNYLAEKGINLTRRFSACRRKIR